MSVTLQYLPNAMERHVTFIDPPEKAANQWLQRQKTSPPAPTGNQLSLPVMRRPVTRVQNGTCNTNEKGQVIQREATQLFERERSRLMEKPGATTTHRHSHEGTAWGEKGGTQHTQYIRRLADLRDELINQEETALARALDRLRLHSINNRDAARYRLKIKDPAVESPRVPGMSVNQSTNFPRPMVTTVEKFRQMRPERRPPVIFPLQGKQLIESGAGSGNNNNGATRPAAEEGPRVDDTVKANLQRLIQPTSSIPNIGRKALRQESLELKSQSLQQQNVRNRVFKTPRAHFASPFMLHAASSQDGEDGHGRGSGGGYGGIDSRAESEGEFHLSPHAYKLGPMMDGDRLNMDKLNQYYYICCLPPDTPADMSREGGERRSVSMTPRQAQSRPGHYQRGLRSVGGGGPGQKPRRTHSERVSSQQVPPQATGNSRPYSDRGGSSVGGGMAISCSDMDMDVASVSSMIANPRFRHSTENLNGGAGERVSLLPIIQADGESPSASHGVHSQLRHNGLDSTFLTQHQQPHKQHHQHQHRERGGASSPDTSLSTERRRRHIVVDMPHIIFNAATPDISKEPTVVEQFPLPERPGALSKTLKQNEIRHRELQNLLEDVKELNKRTETLNTHAQNTEFEFDAQQPAGVC